MQSILIVGTIEETKKKALEIIKENKISKFDTDIIETIKTLGIGEIRLLQKRVFLKPIKSEQKGVILEAFLGITIDSQNAFLKLLEEPPTNTIIIILVNSTDFLLPTILSRCNVINLKKTENLAKENLDEYLKYLNMIQKGHEILKLAEKFGKSREEALSFLENLMLIAHKDLENDKSLVKLLKNMQKTYTIIKTSNISPRFALENLFLNV